MFWRLTRFGAMSELATMIREVLSLERECGVGERPCPPPRITDYLVTGFEVGVWLARKWAVALISSSESVRVMAFMAWLGSLRCPCLKVVSWSIK